MKQARCLLLVGLAALVGLSAWQLSAIRAQTAPAAQWIWYDEGDPLKSAPSAMRYFRRPFTLTAAPQQASLEITADNSFAVWVNGTRVGEGDAWQTLKSFNVAKHLRAGGNVLAVEAKNEGGPAGLVVRLTYQEQDKQMLLVSDHAWRSSKTAPTGWEKSDFDDAKWAKVKVLGAYGKVGPWGVGKGGGKGRAGGARAFKVPEGFKVLPGVKNPGDRGQFSLVNMTFDAKGRLLVSQEGGPTLLCTKPDKDGVLQEVKDYCTQVRNSHGMCWVGDALYLVGNGPKGTGLYRCRDTKRADEIDEVTLIHRFQGGMGEHGPHAVRLGPDGCLYVVVGNHAFVSIGPKKSPNPEKLAANSPLRRWPTGGMGPDQGKPGSTEDVLLPRLNDARGHAANMLAPGGTIWRMDLDGKNVALVAAGFRNQFDAAFSSQGELFSFDSDMEWDEGLPWYRAVRAVHCPPGADFVWRTGAANTPNYYLDSLPPLVETGRGSPVGVEFYDHVAFPEKYRGAFFMADWSIGVIYAVHLKRKGASYEATTERFCTGSPLNVTDLSVGREGAMWFTTGGRGSAGGVWRIVAMKDGKPVDIGPAADLPPYSSGLDDKNPERRAYALWRLGASRNPSEDAITKALTDEDALVRRRACEALIRAGVEPPVESLWPLLAETDPFVRTAARLVLERIDATKWVDRLATEKSDLRGWECIIALCKSGRAADHAEAIFARLRRPLPAEKAALLGYLRTVQLACFHVPKPPAAVKEIAASCDKRFPHVDAQVNRELAILLTDLRRKDVLDTSVHAKLLEAIKASKSDRPQQIHYFYCLRFLHKGWSKEQKEQLTSWYEATRDWRGGASFTPFLENIYREILTGFTAEDRKAILAQADKLPQASLVVAQRLAADRQPELLPSLKAVPAGVGKGPRGKELRQAVDEAILRTACEHPNKDYFADLVRGLSSPSKLLVFDAIQALRKIDAMPKQDDPAPYRALLSAAGKLDAGNRWRAVELLRHWSKGREFGADAGQWKPELAAWTKWFGQAFPKESPLADVEGDRPAVSKYKFEELLTFLTNGDGKAGDTTRGKQVFDKAQCAKCHKFGKEGEGLGPDLTTLAKRFKRRDTLESLFYPSKVISDQYRSTSIVTVKGQRIDGLMAVQGDGVTVLQSDGAKLTLSKADIDRQVASLVSVMPEKLLDTLTKQEIADLFAYLDSDASK